MDTQRPRSGREEAAKCQQPANVVAAEPSRGRRPPFEPEPPSEPPPSRPSGAVRAAIVGSWRSRYGAPLAGQVAVILALLLLYRLGRTLGQDEAPRAFDNARDVLAIEDRLGIDTELSFQRAVLDHTGLLRLLNRYYASVHFPASVAFLIFIYVRAPKLVAHIRFLFVAVTAAGLILHLVYPLAPPRMLNGYVDTIARYGPAIYDRSAVASTANQFAAMPSLHFGWAVLVAYGVVRALNTRWRLLIVLHPAITLAAIVLTANHYWLDALVALALFVAAMAVAPETQLARAERRPTGWTG
jgi:PAP2 superfamily